jgi:hypothetical protein
MYVNGLVNKFPKIISGIYGEGLIASILFHIEAKIID